MATENPYPSGLPYADQPPAPLHISAKDVRPRRIWYLVAVVLGLVLVAVGTIFFVTTVKEAVHSIDTPHSFPSGESRTFGFVQGETKAIYVSQSGQGHVECRIPEMHSGSMTQPESKFRITVGSRTWERVFEVKPDSSGDYTLTCASEVPAEFALGDKPRVGDTIGSIAAGIGCLLAAFVTSATITVVTAVRRSRHRRRLATASVPSAQWGPTASGSTPGTSSGAHS